MLVIGDYKIKVAISGEQAPAVLPQSPLQEVAPVAAPPAQMQYVDTDDSLSSSSIFDFGKPAGGNFDPLGMGGFAPQQVVPDQFSSPPPLMPGFRGAESDHAPPEQQVFSMAKVNSSVPPPAPEPVRAAAPSAIPDDYDPLADFLPPKLAKQAPPPPPVQAPRPQPVADATPGWQAPDDAAALLNNMFEPAVQPSAPAPVFVPAPAPAPVSAPTPAPVPAPISMAKPAAPAPRPGAAPAHGASDSEALQALLRGLQLPDLPPQRSPVELAEVAGAMLREATAGTMGVLLARAMTKRESRLDMTIMSSSANNPLKFFPDVETALTQMLCAPMRGYMAPVRAYANAFDDLRAHELAMLAGMRAALADVLKRFDPAQIEERMQVPTVMEKVMIANRKAKMWDMLVDLYSDMTRDADDDFQRIFGEQFGRAYEEQIARLREAAKQG